MWGKKNTTCPIHLCGWNTSELFKCTCRNSSSKQNTLHPIITLWSVNWTLTCPTQVGARIWISMTEAPQATETDRRFSSFTACDSFSTVGNRNFWHMSSSEFLTLLPNCCQQGKKMAFKLTPTSCFWQATWFSSAAVNHIRCLLACLFLP